MLKFEGWRLRAIRRHPEVHVNQEELAHRVGVSPHSIRRYEQGASSPGLRMIGLLAETLAIEPANFFDEEAVSRFAQAERIELEVEGAPTEAGLPPSSDETDMTREAGETAVDEVLRAWLAAGADFAPNGMPAHPELLFRLQGEWRGWNEILETPETGAESDENALQDRLEARAYQKFLVAVHTVLTALAWVDRTAAGPRVAEIEAEAGAIHADRDSGDGDGE